MVPPGTVENPMSGFNTLRFHSLLIDICIHQYGIFAKRTCDFGCRSFPAVA